MGYEKRLARRQPLFSCVYLQTGGWVGVAIEIMATEPAIPNSRWTSAEIVVKSSFKSVELR